MFIYPLWCSRENKTPDQMVSFSPGEFPSRGTFGKMEQKFGVEFESVGGTEAEITVKEICGVGVGKRGELED